MQKSSHQPQFQCSLRAHQSLQSNLQLNSNCKNHTQGHEQLPKQSWFACSRRCALQLLQMYEEHHWVCHGWCTGKPASAVRLPHNSPPAWWCLHAADVPWCTQLPETLVYLALVQQTDLASSLQTPAHQTPCWNYIGRKFNRNTSHPQTQEHPKLVFQ